MTLKTPYIKIDEHGIDLIKNYRAYRHFDYREINQIEMKRGHLVKNWWISLMLGAITIIGGLFLGRLAIENISLYSVGVESSKTSLMLEISPWLLFVGGLILTYQAIVKSEIIIISTDLKKYRIALKEFEKENKIQEVIVFLSERTKLKRI